eukprot:g58961.t1
MGRALVWWAIDMPAVTLELSSDYGYVMMVAGVLYMENLLIGGKVMGVRKKLFGPEGKLATNKEFNEMQEQHKKAVGSPLILGYPDMGCGKHSMLLAYEDWLEFNNVQRGHYNLVESMATTMATLLLAGIQYPRVASGFGLTFAVGRWLYAAGYAKGGAKGREIGALLGGLTGLANCGLTFYSGAKMAGVLSIFGM